MNPAKAAPSAPVKQADDQRLMNSTLPDDPNSKLNACVNNVLRIWNDTKEQKLTQLIF